MGIDEPSSAVWRPVALVLAAPVALAFVPFRLALPVKIAMLKVGAGLLFVTGAAGVETISSFHDDTSLAYLGWMALEEAMEMAGIALYLFALLRLAALERRHLQLVMRD